MHWLDEQVGQVEDFIGSKAQAVFSAGLSVSGLQHVGRLRGEIILNSVLAPALRAKGRSVRQFLVLYTQDNWKGKPSQLSQFDGDEGKKYVSWRLIDVPDPKGCHANWVDHYWEDFGGVLDRYAPDVQTVTTTELYQRAEMKAIVADLIARAEDVRRLVNKFRGRKKYPAGWVPFEPQCHKCRRIGSARALAADDGMVDYECSCGDRGSSSIEGGKLNWRLEWPSLWKVLHVDVEPFGKDHAAPGGSRDSCKEIARAFLDIEPPYGIPYEWVGYVEHGKDLGDMSSSSFLGFTPRDWLAVGEPEVMRYVFLLNPIHRRVVLDLSKVDYHHDQYDEGERAYYAEKTEETAYTRRTYELAQMAPPPKEAPFQLSYRHAAYLVQIAPTDDTVEWSLRRLRDTGLLREKLSGRDHERVARRLAHAARWVATYAPADYRVRLLETLTPEVAGRLTEEDRQALAALARGLNDARWNEEQIKDVMVTLQKEKGLPVSQRRFFEALYLVFVGQERGPRAAPFLSVLQREFVLKRLAEASA